MASDAFSFLDSLVDVPEDQERPRARDDKPALGQLVVGVRLNAKELDFRFGGKQDDLLRVCFVEEMEDGTTDETWSD
jgi:hypothetical protein